MLTYFLLQGTNESFVFTNAAGYPEIFRPTGTGPLRRPSIYKIYPYFCVHNVLHGILAASWMSTLFDLQVLKEGEIKT